MEALYIPLLALLVPVLYFYLERRALTKLRQRVAETWAALEADLRQRCDLLPELADTARRHAATEAELPARLLELRQPCLAGGVPSAGRSRDENNLVDTLKRVLALADGFPGLKSDPQFLRLQDELLKVELRIQAGRRRYNGTLRNYLQRCERFPSNTVASAFQFPPADYFSLAPVFAQVPNTDFERTQESAK